MTPDPDPSPPAQEPASPSLDPAPPDQLTHQVEPSSDARRIIEELTSAIRDDPDTWFFAMLGAVREWSIPEETVGERTYRYLIAGEAFDWLLLAERLCDALGDLLPQDDVGALLFHGRPPVELTEDDWKQLLGAKYRPHLNFVYGVHVESALQHAALEAVYKEHQSRVWEDGHADDESFQGIYGKTLTELLAESESECGRQDTGSMSLTDVKEFTYWLFRYRVRTADPARVASDTRKGMAALQELQALRAKSWPELK